MENLLTEFEAAEVLSVSVSTLRKDRSKQHLKIPCIYLSKSVRYVRAELLEWALGQRTPLINTQRSPTAKKRGRPTKSSVLGRS
jgi:hypothetical protein